MKETDLNTLSISQDKQVIAVGDNLGRIRVLNYPAFNLGQASLKLDVGHTNGVSSVLFTPGGLRQQLLITIGKKDLAIMIWLFDPSKLKTAHRQQESQLLDLKLP